MSQASDKLARSRQAILEHVARRQRKHDPREELPGHAFSDESFGYADEPPPDPGAGWFGHLSHGVKTWWRYHPAHMAVELATPLMRGYARRKPLQLLAISMAAGAALTIVALLKSSQLSHLFMAAMSAADYRKDHDRPG
jgi:hypothetical protein